MLYYRVVREVERLKKLESELEAKIAQLPWGKLVCSRSKKSYKWYRSDGHEKIYIPKSERKVAEQLALKKLLSHVLRNVKREMGALGFYLRHHKESADELESMLKRNPGLRELLAPWIKPLSRRQMEWMQADYERNESYPEYLLHETISGHMVRSKSEVLIDLVLSQHQIPFRYECALQLGDKKFYPDFTIRHPKTDEVIYWEHFGLMDDTGYQRNTAAKLQTYFNYNIIPSINLITTYETKEAPLTYGRVKVLVEWYFS